MATRNGIHISGHYVVSINAICIFVYVLCILKHFKVGQNRTLYCFKNSTTIRHDVLISGYVESIPTDCKFEMN